VLSLQRNRIHADVPNFPEEVVDSWLVPMVRSGAGWPPAPWSRWNRILLGRPLSFWQGLAWSKVRVPLNSLSLAPESLRIVQGLIDANVHGISNTYSQQIRDSRGRFNRILRYVRTRGELPVPPVLLRVGIQYRVADGNHRVAAWLYAEPAALLGPLCWVAHPERAA
jgi:hypothetical protein